MSVKERPVIVLCGATATGKTALAVMLAETHRMQVISADARQIFSGMQFGTAAPTPVQLLAVPHSFVGTLNPTQPWSSAIFAEQARAAINALPPTTLPVIVGGAGLYISALLDGFSPDLVPSTPTVRLAARRIFDLEGKDAAWEMLHRLDPVAADTYADRNPRRVQRALEYNMMTGLRMSDTWQTKPAAAPYATVRIGLTLDRLELYNKINHRCEVIWDGLVAEARELLQRGFTQSSQCLQTVGYAEAIRYLSGTLPEADALALMQQNTRRYAKRQETWFKRDERITWFNAHSETLIGDVQNLLHVEGFDRYRLNRVP